MRRVPTNRMVCEVCGHYPDAGIGLGWKMSLYCTALLLVWVRGNTEEAV